MLSQPESYLTLPPSGHPPDPGLSALSFPQVPPENGTRRRQGRKLSFRQFLPQSINLPFHYSLLLRGGAVHTPHLLKLSGIGPSEELHKHRIHVIKHNPHVGDHLVDHPVIDVYFKDKNNAGAVFLKPKNLREFIRLIQELRKYRARQPGTALAMNVSDGAKQSGM